MTATTARWALDRLSLNDLYELLIGHRVAQSRADQKVSDAAPRIDIDGEIATIFEGLAKLGDEITKLSGQRSALHARYRMLIQDHVASLRGQTSGSTPGAMPSSIAA